MTPARATFQTQFFVAALTATILALGVAGILFAGTMRRQVDDQIESTLFAETRLAAELLSRTAPLPTIPELQDEAIRIGELLSARVTLHRRGRTGRRRFVREAFETWRRWRTTPSVPRSWKRARAGSAGRDARAPA